MTVIVNPFDAGGFTLAEMSAAIQMLPNPYGRVGQLGLFAPGPPTLDAASAQALRELVAKGAMPPLVLVVSDCRAAHARMKAAGVEFTQEPVDRYGTVDAGFRDPSGNGWKMIQSR